MSYSNMTPISTPSPEEMYKRYTSIDTLNDPRIDEVLKHAMTGGNPNFPGIYATMALDARNNNRAQAKFQQAQQQTQQQGRQPTVVDHIIAQAPVEQRLTQGMGSLPVDESTFHAAGGGMVSFADEGLVEGDTPYVKNDPRYETDSVPGAFLFDSQDEAAAKLKRSNTRSAKAASAKATSDKAPDASTSGKKPAPEIKKDIKKGADKGIAALQPNVTQAEKDIAAETAARYHKMVGEDPDAADRKARMEALGLSNAEAKRRAPWMALANAGFGMMAGESQYAMQNIGAGAQQGLAHLSESQKDIARAQERHAAMQDAIGERDYARRAKGAELGMSADAAAKLAAARVEEQRRDIGSRQSISANELAALTPIKQATATAGQLKTLNDHMKLLTTQLDSPQLSPADRATKQAELAKYTQYYQHLSGMGVMPQAAGAPDEFAGFSRIKS